MAKIGKFKYDSTPIAAALWKNCKFRDMKSTCTEFPVHHHG